VWDDEEDLEVATTAAQHDEDEDEAMFTEEAFPAIPGAGFELEESYSSLPGSIV
jgi:hypothetical protein